MQRIGSIARILICGALGLGAWMTQVPPNDAVVNACKWFAVYGKDCPHWLNESNIPVWTPLVLGLASVAMLVWALWPYVNRKLARRHSEDGFIAMREAATKAYEALRTTVWAEFADLPGAPGDTPEARRILYMANALKLPLYGKKPPSRQYEKIEEVDRPLRDDGHTFSYRTSDNEYIDIAVKSDDLKTAIERMQTV